jgi:hypothetical protein
MGPAGHSLGENGIRAAKEPHLDGETAGTQRPSCDGRMVTLPTELICASAGQTTARAMLERGTATIDPPFAFAKDRRSEPQS